MGKNIFIQPISQNYKETWSSNQSKTFVFVVKHNKQLKENIEIILMKIEILNLNIILNFSLIKACYTHASIRIQFIHIFNTLLLIYRLLVSKFSKTVKNKRLYSFLCGCQAD